MESHDELDRLIMGGVSMRYILEWEEILPIREYERFAKDVRQRWQQ